jgi:hypothetical protein
MTSADRYRSFPVTEVACTTDGGWARGPTLVGAAGERLEGGVVNRVNGAWASTR